METYIKVSANIHSNNENEIIINSQETIPSDIPYVVKLDNNEDSRFVILKLEYIPKEERLSRLNPNKSYEIEFGEKTGKIYEFKYQRDLNSKQIKEILSEFRKDQIKKQPSFRFINNLKSTIKIVTDAIKLNSISNSALQI